MKIADDAAAIKARMEEIQRERMQAIMGKPNATTVAALEEAEAGLGEVYHTWGYFATDDLPTA